MTLQGSAQDLAGHPVSEACRNLKTKFDVLAACRRGARLIPRLQTCIACVQCLHWQALAGIPPGSAAAAYSIWHGRLTRSHETLLHEASLLLERQWLPLWTLALTYLHTCTTCTHALPLYVGLHASKAAASMPHDIVHHCLAVLDDQGICVSLRLLAGLLLSQDRLAMSGQSSYG